MFGRTVTDVGKEASSPKRHKKKKKKQTKKRKLVIQEDSDADQNCDQSEEREQVSSEISADSDWAAEEDCHHLVSSVENTPTKSPRIKRQRLTRARASTKLALVPATQQSSLSNQPPLTGGLDSKISAIFQELASKAKSQIDSIMNEVFIEAQSRLAQAQAHNVLKH